MVQDDLPVARQLECGAVKAGLVEVQARTEFPHLNRPAPFRADASHRALSEPLLVGAAGRGWRQRGLGLLLAGCRWKWWHWRRQSAAMRFRTARGLRRSFARFFEIGEDLLERCRKVDILCRSASSWSRWLARVRGSARADRGLEPVLEEVARSGASLSRCSRVGLGKRAFDNARVTDALMSSLGSASKKRLLPCAPAIEVSAAAQPLGKLDRTLAKPLNAFSVAFWRSFSVTPAFWSQAGAPDPWLLPVGSGGREICSVALLLGACAGDVDTDPRGPLLTGATWQQVGQFFLVSVRRFSESLRQARLLPARQARQRGALRWDRAGSTWPLLVAPSVDVPWAASAVACRVRALRNRELGVRGLAQLLLGEPGEWVIAARSRSWSSCRRGRLEALAFFDMGATY